MLAERGRQHAHDARQEEARLAAEHLYATKKPVAGRQLVELRLSEEHAERPAPRACATRGATVFFDVTAFDAAGNSIRRKGQIALHAAKARRHH